MEQGYSKKRRAHLLPLIRSKQSFKMENMLKQKILISQLKQLDQMIKDDSINIINGLIFTTQHKPRIIEQLKNCIKKDHNLISYGFQIWKQITEPQLKHQKMNLVCRKDTFKSKLHNCSIKNIEQYEIQKMKQLSRIQEKIPTRYQTQQKTSKNNISRAVKYREYTTTNNTPQKEHRPLKYLDFNQKKMNTQISQSVLQQSVTLQKISKMLLSQKHNITSVWLPPKSYPQFYGIFVASFTKNAPFRCRIKKYIFFRQALNKRFFEGIIQYLDKSKEKVIQNVEMIVNKCDFYEYFQPYGWKMKCWEGVEKIMATYSLNYSRYS